MINGKEFSGTSKLHPGKRSAVNGLDSGYKKGLRGEWKFLNKNL